MRYPQKIILSTTWNEIFYYVEWQMHQKLEGKIPQCDCKNQRLDRRTVVDLWNIFSKVKMQLKKFSGIY